MPLSLSFFTVLSLSWWLLPEAEPELRVGVQLIDLAGYSRRQKCRGENRKEVRLGKTLGKKSRSKLYL